MPTSTARGGTVTKPQTNRNTVRSFTVASRHEAPEADRAPLPFFLDYKDSDGEAHRSPACTAPGCQGLDYHSWHARPWLISDVIIMELINMPISEESAPFFRLLQSALGDDYRGFETWIHNPEVFVDMEQFRPILEWFVEEGAGRPTQPS